MTEIDKLTFMLTGAETEIKRQCKRLADSPLFYSEYERLKKCIENYEEIFEMLTAYIKMSNNPKK